ncbi:MAG: Gmad2 immunoglobulin-like domain-containing protein [Nocardioides sp.]
MNVLRSRSVALSLATVLSAATLAGCGNDPDPVASDPGSSAEPSSPSTSTDPTTEPEPTEPTAPTEPADTVAAPVYFVGETPMGQRLFREFRKVEADNPYAEAVALMVAGDVADPDYDSAFPDGRFAGVEVDEAEGVILVEAADDGWNTLAPGMTQAQAELAVQQLVYTVQGIAQERLPVRVWLGDPANAVPLFGIDTAAGLQAADPLDVLALVNVTSPEEGSTVSDRFVANGLASSFEATVPWQIRQGDTVVLKGFATAEGWMDKLYPWQSDVDVSGLAPGDYTFVAMTDDPSGGEGPGPFEDSKSITVE